MIETVKAMSEWMTRLTITHFMQPPLSSEAGQNLDDVRHDKVREERMTNGLALAGMRFHAGRSCLDALVACQTLPDPVTPTHTLARVVFETAAWAKWLSERGLDVEQRIARIAADELHGKAEKDSIAKESGQTLTGADDFRALLRTNAITPARRPRSTEVVGQVLGSPIAPQIRMMYRLLCAHPHASSHTLLSEITQFTDPVMPFRHAAQIYMWAFFEYATFIEWEHLPEWVEWAEAAKVQLNR